MDRSKVATTHVMTAFINMTQPDQIRAAFRVGATDYLTASNALGSTYSASAYMLVFHAIELGLKGYLAGKGFTISQMRNRFSHDLVKLYDEAKNQGMVLNEPEAEGFIEWYNEFHSYAAPIRYEFAESQPLPPIDIARRIAEEIKVAA